MRCQRWFRLRLRIDSVVGAVHGRIRPALATLGAVIALGGVAPAAAGEAVTALGQTTPVHAIDLAVQVPGEVARVAVEEGDRVVKGQLLVALDDALQQAVLELARLRARASAEREKATLELAEARVMLERIEGVFAKGAAGEWEARRARLRVELSEAARRGVDEALALAAAEVAVEEERLRRHRLTAPVDGIVRIVDVEVGQTVAPGTAVIHLAVLTQLKAVVHVPVVWLPRLRVGSEHDLQAGAPVGRSLRATLRFIDPVMDPASGTFRCVFMIDNAAGALPAGFPVSLHF